MRSRKPFSETVKELLKEKGWSLRELQRRTQKETGWGSVSTVSYLVNGQEQPTFEAMERIAAVLRVPPTTFAEYRLEEARRDLDWTRQTLPDALETLDRLDRVREPDPYEVPDLGQLRDNLRRLAADDFDPSVPLTELQRNALTTAAEALAGFAV